MIADLRALAGGVVCTGFDGTALDADFEAALRELPLAGLILFGRNVESVAQTRALTERIRAVFAEVSPVAPIVAIDQEGGRVVRLRAGVEEIPSMMALSATNDSDLAWRAGEQIAFDLLRAGVNLDLAPVLDLALQRNNTAIGARSFGSDPRFVAEFAGAVAAGMRAAGIVPTYKHFPGHGSTAVDSHIDLPVIEDDIETLRGRDLLPFLLLLPGAQAVMTTHIVFKALDSALPATLSPRILTSLLRDDVGFNGVCFTDCMQMNAIAKSVGTCAGAVLAIAAGADCILISHSIDLARQCVEAIVSAVREGRLPSARLQDAFDRTSGLRHSLAAPLPLDAAAPSPGIGRTIGRRAVTLVRGEAAADPAQSLIVTFEGTTTEGVTGTHSDHASLAAALGAGMPELRVELDPSPRHVDEMVERVGRSSRRPIVLMRRANIYPQQARAIERLLALRPDALLVSVQEPTDAFDFPQARNVLCTYGDDSPSIAGLADAILDGEKPEGRLPLEISAVG